LQEISFTSVFSSLFSLCVSFHGGQGGIETRSLSEKEERREISGLPARKRIDHILY